MGSIFLCRSVLGISNNKKLAAAQTYRESTLRMVRTIACCLALWLSSPAVADVRIRLLFDGSPFVSELAPEFACLDDAKQQWFDCGLTRTDVPGEYRRKDLAPGSYVILIGIDENRNNLKNMDCATSFL